MLRGIVAGIIWFALSVIACSEHQSGPDASSGLDAKVMDASTEDAGQPDARPTRTVTASATYHFQLENGDVLSARIEPNLGSDTLWVEDGSGGFTSFPAIDDGEGVRFEKVPEGRYALVSADPESTVSSNFVTYSSLSVLDFSAAISGRPNLTFPTLPTPLVLSGSGLDAWQDGDDLELSCFNANVALRFLNSVPTAPQVGATELQNLTIDFAQEGVALIDADEGDRAFLLQLVATPIPEGHYRVARRILDLDGLTMIEGQTNTASRAFAAIPATDMATIDFRLSEFDALRTSVNPNAVFRSRALDIYGLRRAHQFGWYGTPATWASVFPYDATGDFSITLEYGNPFPEWDQMVTALNYYYVEYLADGANVARRSFARIETVLALDESRQVVLRPLVGTPKNPRINGLDGFAPQSGVGLTPRLSWDPPDIGVPARYQIHIVLIENDGGETVVRRVGHMWTETTEIVVPPGILTTNTPFFVRIMSQVGIAPPPRHARFSLPEAYVELLTAMMRP